MHIAHTKEELRSVLAPRRGHRVVLVPTMGALHEGHASLLRQARELAGASGCVVASVFLNPVQFDNAGDLKSYPTNPQGDLQVCERCGVDVVFMPTPDVMYAPDRSVVLEETYLSSVLCGARRPGHFAGVCLVREEAGRALSSRNALLTPALRALAPRIRKALLVAKADFESGTDPEDVCRLVESTLGTLPEVRLDYVSLVDAETLHELTDLRRPALLAVAAFFGEVRLIDNIEMQR